MRLIAIGARAPMRALDGLDDTTGKGHSTRAGGDLTFPGDPNEGRLHRHPALDLDANRGDL